MLSHDSFSSPEATFSSVQSQTISSSLKLDFSQDLCNSTCFYQIFDSAYPHSLVMNLFHLFLKKVHEQSYFIPVNNLTIIILLLENSSLCWLLFERWQNSSYSSQNWTQRYWSWHETQPPLKKLEKLCSATSSPT